MHIQGDLFAVDRIIYGQLRPEDIQYYIVFHENWKLLFWYLLYFSWLRNTQSFSNSLKAFLAVSMIIFSVIIVMQNVCNLIGWNSMNILGFFNYYRANINGMWNAEKLGGIYKTFEFTLTYIFSKLKCHSINKSIAPEFDTVKVSHDLKLM